MACYVSESKAHEINEERAKQQLSVLSQRRSYIRRRRTRTLFAIVI